jgi:hypothetical protein
VFLHRARGISGRLRVVALEDRRSSPSSELPTPERGLEVCASARHHAPFRRRSTERRRGLVGKLLHRALAR